MKAKSTQINNLFDGLCQYRVPRYQRPYEWQRANWSALWEDIVELDKSRRGINGGQDNTVHFLGAMVRRQSGIRDNVEQYDIIDGQQRIVTLMLLLKALLFVWSKSKNVQISEENANRPADRINNILLNPPNIDQKYRPIVIPGKLDQNAYFAVLGLCDLSDLDTDNIHNAYKYFTRCFKRWMDDELGEDNDPCIALNGLLSTILTGLEIVLLTLDPFDSDYEVFESLNAKGMKLTESDKVRNFCFMHLKESGKIDLDNFHENEWINMEKSVSPPKRKSTTSKELDRFMTSWTFMKTGWIFPEKQLYRRTTEYLLHSTTENPDIDEDTEAELIYDYFSDMTSYASAYRMLQWPTSKPIVASHRITNIIEILKGPLGLKSAAHPILIYVFRLFIDLDRDEDALVKFLKYLESYVVRRYACLISKGEQYNHRIFTKVAHSFLTQKIQTIDECSECILRLLCAHDHESQDRWPKDDEFQRSLFTNQIYSRGSGDRFAKYILLSLEGEEQYTTKKKDVYVEQILPSKLTHDWNDMLGATASDTKQKFLNTIGNLVLVAEKNSVNSSFAEKKVNYRDSVYGATKEIAHYTNWDETALRRRFDAMKDKFVSRWPHPHANNDWGNT